MLVITRKAGESIVIARDIEVEVLGVMGGRVRLGITAPKDTRVDRKENLEGDHGTANDQSSAH